MANKPPGTNVSDFVAFAILDGAAIAALEEMRKCPRAQCQRGRPAVRYGSRSICPALCLGAAR
jgi:hypothetical protein